MEIQLKTLGQELKHALHEISVKLESLLGIDQEAQDLRHSNMMRKVNEQIGYVNKMVTHAETLDWWIKIDLLKGCKAYTDNIVRKYGNHPDVLAATNTVYFRIETIVNN